MWGRGASGKRRDAKGAEERAARARRKVAVGWENCWEKGTGALLAAGAGGRWAVSGGDGEARYGFSARRSQLSKRAESLESREAAAALRRRKWPQKRPERRFAQKCISWGTGSVSW